MEGAVGLGEIWCHKEKELTEDSGCGDGGSGMGSRGAGNPSTPGGKDGQQSFLLWEEKGSPGLFCIASQVLMRSLVKEFGNWGALFCPSHSTCLDPGGAASGPLLS